jgi:predicted type IV restriction endonuclease
MDFIDQIKQFSKRVKGISETIETEEATKMSIILPFFQMLGYDVFNPNEFLPEFTADVGIKKGEKVDFAILNNNCPIILIEAKSCREKLDKHGSQLFRYFGTTSAKFGILTNGITYQFFTDLTTPNKMDDIPFLEFDLLDIKDNLLLELKKFHKDAFDIDTIFSTASELKDSTKIMKLLSQQLKNPSDGFIKYILGEFYEGPRTQNVIDRYRELVKKSFNQFISDIISDKIATAFKSTESEEKKTEETKTEDELPVLKESKIITTEEELEGFFIVKQILAEILDKSRVTYKDTESYFGILFENNTRKWICRLKLDGQKTIFFPTEDKKIIKFNIDSIDDITNYTDLLREITERYLK